MSCKGGIIVLHEWWGVTDAIQGEAAMIASEGGFVTLVPDLYRGKVTDDRETAGHYKVKFNGPNMTLFTHIFFHI